MTDQAARWLRVGQLCEAGLARPGVERVAFLRDACVDDEALRHEVDQLLAQKSEAAGFLQGSVAVVAAGVMSQAPGSLTGQRLNAVEIAELIGVGGMGEVYRARDTRLNREVAVKLLPATFAERVNRTSGVQEGDPFVVPTATVAPSPTAASIRRAAPHPSV